mgnify:CR=1 FL=1|jgi:hypothetical protein
MSTFIKICPKCAHQNPEYENACAACAYFIGMETPVSSTTAKASPGAGGGEVHPQAAEPESAASQAAPQAGRSQGQSTLYLQVLGSERTFEVRDGWSVGQSHASSDADLQLRDLPGVDYLHRNHCRFSCVDGDWQVTPIDQRQLGRDFTNPTAVNDNRLAPGEAHSISNGDQLTLATVKMLVRII